MDFPFETTTKDGRKATVIGTMPDGRLFGFVKFAHAFAAWDWNADGSDSSHDTSIIIPLQIKPLTTYRTRKGKIVWTSGLIRDGWIYGLYTDCDVWRWRVADGRWHLDKETPFDLIEELPPGTTV